MIKRTLILSEIILVGLACTISVSCSKNTSDDNKLILTEAPGNVHLPDYSSGASWRNLSGARIISVDLERPGSQKTLTKDFYSACFPEISYDGKSILFAGQHKENDPWQIWEMNLKTRKYRQVTSGSEECTDPAWLPGERIVFSKLTANDTVKSAYCLFTCNADGSGLRQITFSPEDNLATTVLKDGRLLTVKNQLLPVQVGPMLAVMRPDGTKADKFYTGPGNSKYLNRAHETDDGRIIFAESDSENHTRSRLVSISYNRPLHTRTDLTTSIPGDFYNVLPLRPDKYLVSYRKSDSDRFALYEFNPEKGSLGPAVFNDPDYHILDIVRVKPYERPKKLPSEVDIQVKTGLLLCQDINFKDPFLPDNSIAMRKALKIEVLGVDTTYGVVDVEKDGSFQLKIMADKPFRIRILDKDGNVVNGPCSWLWLRPNERRGCIGCHENPELAPENIVSLAVKKSPVIIPVHITDVKEKLVELE
ncbi:MAG: hypothetical protein WCD55_11720 [Bacteroidales bacterium]